MELPDLLEVPKDYVFVVSNNSWYIFVVDGFEIFVNNEGEIFTELLFRFDKFTDYSLFSEEDVTLTACELGRWGFRIGFKDLYRNPSILGTITSIE